MSDSLGLVDFVIGLLNSILNLHDVQVKCLGGGGILITEKLRSILLIKIFSGYSSNDSWAGTHSVPVLCKKMAASHFVNKCSINNIMTDEEIAYWQ